MFIIIIKLHVPDVENAILVSIEPFHLLIRAISISVLPATHSHNLSVYKKSS